MRPACCSCTASRPGASSTARWSRSSPTPGSACVAPDLVGFGRSDKPPQRTDYTYQRHVDWMRAALVEQLDLLGSRCSCQDWGGLIGLRLVAEQRALRARRRREHVPPDRRPPPRRRLPRLAEVLAGDADVPGRQDRERRLHDRPCRPKSSPRTTRRSRTRPTRKARGSSRCWCRPAPTTPRPTRTGRRGRSLRRWDKPFLTAFSDSDPITAGGDRVLQADVPGTNGRPHTTIEGAGHFLQEDRGEQIARVVVDFITATPGS